MATAGEKDPGALLTIGELSHELGVAQHILRYWETRFPQLRPMQRAGNRRYYRPADVELARQINRLLNHEGYTVRGVQKLLRDRTPIQSDASSPLNRSPDGRSLESHSNDRQAADADQAKASNPINRVRLIALRNRLAAALES